MPGSLVSMKRKKTFVDGMGAVSHEVGEEFPHGLLIHLRKEQLMSLGISMNDLPQVGDGVMIKARGEVRSVSMHDDGSQKDVTVGIQITDMAVVKEEEKAKEVEEKEGDGGIFS